MSAKQDIDPRSEADGAGLADVPDMQPCSGLGNIPVEAQAEVGRAMGTWVDVAREDRLPTPKPRYRGVKRATG